MMEAWHKLVLSGKVVGISNLLSDEITLDIPFVRTPIEGKPFAIRYLTASFYTLINESFKYVREVRQEQIAFLEFEVMLEGVFIQGIQVIEWNAENQITHFKVMFGSLKGLQVIQQKMDLLLGDMTYFLEKTISDTIENKKHL